MLLLSKEIGIILPIMLIISCGQSKKKDPNLKYFETATEYNAYINQQFEEINRLWNATLTSMDDSTLVYKELDSLKLASKKSWENMNKLADYKGDTLFRYAAANYFSYIHVTANTSFEEAIGIGLMEDMPDSLYFRFTSIGNQIGADKDTLINKLKAAQLHFMRIDSE